MRSVVVMSGPAVRKVKGENSKMKEQIRRLARVLAAAEAVLDETGFTRHPEAREHFVASYSKLHEAVIAAKEIVE